MITSTTKIDQMKKYLIKLRPKISNNGTMIGSKKEVGKFIMDESFDPTEIYNTVFGNRNPQEVQPGYSGSNEDCVSSCHSPNIISGNNCFSSSGDPLGVIDPMCEDDSGDYTGEEFRFPTWPPTSCIIVHCSSGNYYCAQVYESGGGDGIGDHPWGEYHSSGLVWWFGSSYCCNWGVGFCGGDGGGDNGWGGGNGYPGYCNQDCEPAEPGCDNCPNTWVELGCGGSWTHDVDMIENGPCHYSEMAREKRCYDDNGNVCYQHSLECNADNPPCCLPYGPDFGSDDWWSDEGNWNQSADNPEWGNCGGDCWLGPDFGGMIDCDGRCFNNTTCGLSPWFEIPEGQNCDSNNWNCPGFYEFCQSWAHDNYCDQGPYVATAGGSYSPLNFNCAEWDYDDGACNHCGDYSACNHNCEFSDDKCWWEHTAATNTGPAYCLYNDCNGDCDGDAIVDPCGCCTEGNSGRVYGASCGWVAAYNDCDCVTMIGPLCTNADCRCHCRNQHFHTTDEQWNNCITINNLDDPTGSQGSCLNGAVPSQSQCTDFCCEWCDMLNSSSCNTDNDGDGDSCSVNQTHSWSC